MKAHKYISYISFLILLIIWVLYFIYPNYISKSEKSEAQTELKNEPPKTDFKAKVVRIIDGDTVEVLHEKTVIKIRLEHIDSPEIRSRQPFGNRAKQAVSGLCFNQNIIVGWKGQKDRYGRYIAVLWNEKGENVNKEMVRLGMAWHYKKYSKDKSYDLLEKEARKNKIGLWADPNPVPPWEWR